MARLRLQASRKRRGESLNSGAHSGFLCGPNLSARYLGTIAVDGGLEWTLVTCGVVLDGFVPRFGATLVD